MYALSTASTAAQCVNQRSMLFFACLPTGLVCLSVHFLVLFLTVSFEMSRHQIGVVPCLYFQFVYER